MDLMAMAISTTGQDQDAIDDEIWWFICSLCHRSYTTHTQLVLHKRTAHNSRDGTADTIIKSQSYDLQPVIKIKRCDGSEEPGVNVNINTPPNLKLDNDQTTTTKNHDKFPQPKTTSTGTQTDEAEAEVPESSRLQAKPSLDIPVTHQSSSNAVTCKFCSHCFPTTAERLLVHIFPSPSHPQPPDLTGPQSPHANESDSNYGDSIVYVKQESGLEDAENADMTLDDDDDPPYEEAQDAHDPLDPPSSSVSDRETEQKARHKKKAPPHTCPLCPRVFKGKRDARSHEDKTHNSPPDRTCSICNKLYSSRKRLRTHMRDCHTKPGLICQSCGRSFLSERFLRSHMKLHDEANRVHVCEVCGYSTFTSKRLKKHMLTHDSDRKFPCPDCGKILKSPETLLDHRKRAHSEARPYKCSKCDSTFKTRTGVRRHSHAVHVDGGRQFPCSICSSSFKSRSHLRGHEKRMHEQAHICRVCGQDFPGRAWTSLLRHEIEAHDYQRVSAKYDCKICGKFFMVKEHFKKHMAHHREEKGFICDVCGKAFKTRPNLNQHSVTHLNSEDYKHECEVCGKKFGQGHHLKAHKKGVHKGVAG